MAERSDMENIVSNFGKKRARLDSASSDSDTDNQDDACNDSSADSSSSDSSIEIKNKKHNPAILDSDSDSSESDWDVSPSQTNSRVPQLDEDSSSESDGQSDKCPICFAKFKGQEIGSPDSCDHSFCYECILEWSKNVTTCPIDRQQFQIILVKKHLDGSIVRQTSVQTQAPEIDAELEDPTYCEICGSCEREDRLLLCDGCDLGYHLECLTPPLQEVPLGSWLCPDCGPEDLQQDITIYVNELEVLYHEAEDIGAPANTRRIPRNVIPRTRQSDRIRARIISNRQSNHVSTIVEHHNIQVAVDQPSTSRYSSVSHRQGFSKRKVTKRKTKRKTKNKKKTYTPKPQIKITYEIDESTGQKIVIQTKSGRRYTKRPKRKSYRKKRNWLIKAAAQTKTTKRRLAKQFGICAPKRPGQILPDMKIPTDNKNLTYLRGQAGIPSLSIFGNRDALDYFSGSDDDHMDEGDGGISGLRAHRRPNLSDVSLYRRSAARKAVLLPQSTNSIDLLGSIMDSQEKMYSKNSVLSLNKDGSLKIDTNKNSNNTPNQNRINVNDRSHIRVRRVPSYSPTDHPANVANVNSPQEYKGDTSEASSSAVISNNSVATSSSDAASSLSHDQENSGLDQDIYSDIETVSTSKVETEDSDKDENPPDEAKSIKEEKKDKTEEYSEEMIKDSQEENVSSTTNVLVNSNSDGPDCSVENTDDEECPNFSIYSKDTINLVANRNLEQDEVGSSLDVKPLTPNLEEEDEQPPPPVTDEEDTPDPENSNTETKIEFLFIEKSEELTNKPISQDEMEEGNENVSNNLYSDSDEDLIKTDKSDAMINNKLFGIVDIRTLTEDISEEERSYTPCLDERVPTREGLEGLETEAISEDEKNDFDESHEHKTVSDGGDALEINAKESELDFTKPDDYEEGEIVDKLKKLEDAKVKSLDDTKVKPKLVAKERDEPPSEPASFKRISKNTKDRNYRDKERDRSRSHSRDRNKENEREKKRERKKEKRKELERYNVRNVVSEKPKKSTKDKFGRDARRRSTSRSSRSASYSPPYRSVSRGRKSLSRERRKRPGRGRSRGRSPSRSRSRSRKRSLSRKRRSFSRSKRRRSIDERNKKRKNRSVSRHRSRSQSPRRHRDWENPQRSRAWSASISRSRSPEQRASPSWTPPRIHENPTVKPHNLTVILTNDSKKKKDKRKADRKKKEAAVEKTKRRKREKTPLPSKEVFASGDNILVSVSFNKDGEELTKRTKQRDGGDEVSTKRTRKEKEKRTRTPPPKSKKKKQLTQELSAVKPVAIIDLDRSPFKELTPSPKDVIVLSDSDHSPEKAIADSSQQTDYALGPKTPPEPQVKFSLAPKAPQIRQINNPLHDPEDEHEETEIDPQDELEQRLIEALHKGPNTPSDPPNSPPSSPDVYDPFDPTKSRSPTPELPDNQNGSQKSELDDSSDKEKLPLSKTPEAPKSHTPPLILTDIQREPADSQSNVTVNIPDDATDTKANQMPNAQGNSPIFATKSKTGAPTMASTPTSSIVTATRLNILNSTLITPLPMQQPRIPPNIAKPSPLKPSPTKASVKMMPKRISAGTSTTKMPKVKNNRSTDSNDSNMELDSPNSPGPSDFDDLFEPPTEHKNVKPKPIPAKPPTKMQNAFDNLFGSSPVNKNKGGKDKNKRPSHPKIKQVGVKFDEDSLRILDELPNSAVEMQVKDKFLKKLNRQERVVEEVKLVLKPHYNKKNINKEEYKDILRRAVPKICHNKAGEINPKKIHSLIEAYVKKLRQSKKVSSSSSVGIQK